MHYIDGILAGTMFKEEVTVVNVFSTTFATMVHHFSLSTNNLEYISYLLTYYLLSRAGVPGKVLMSNLIINTI